MKRLGRVVGVGLGQRSPALAEVPGGAVNEGGTVKDDHSAVY